MKANHGALRDAVAVWVAEHIARPPDWVSVNKRHGRVERREVWVVESHELGAYLARAYGWPGVRWSGRVRRYRKRGAHTAWDEVTDTLWIAGGALDTLTGQQAAGWLRGHWEIENRVFWVRDVRYGEDRSHARAIGPALSALRNVAINLLRRAGFRYLPDGWRGLAARPDRGLALLLSDQPVLLEN